MKLRIYLASLALLCVAAGAYRLRSAPSASLHSSLAEYVPQGALLSIESPDFAALLHRWSNSSQSKAWLTSDNYAVFQNSRLFGRLGDAQESFANAAGVPADIDLLHQVAGKQSVFAWYDIGKLEFLYITRMSASQASQTELLRARGTFKRRHAGNADFYIKTSNTDYSTVAFAQVSTPSGDLLLLATREDLMANALTLIAGHSTIAPLTQEQWFQDATTALPPESAGPALHMVLNLDRIAHDPHFQSYWVQRNITWTRNFRAAASDLYLEKDIFREERALVPKSPAPADPNAPDLAALAAIAPPATGMVRAVATQDPQTAITALQEKLFGTDATATSTATDAPDPDLAAPQAGSANDLEVRIDALPPVSPSASSLPLKQAFSAAGLDAVMTLSSAQSPAQTDDLWVPIHSVVVLHAARPWDAQALAPALQQALRGSLTAANLGIDFHPDPAAGTIYSLAGPKPLFFAVSSATPRGNLVLFSDHLASLQALLQNLSAPVDKPQHEATLIAAFNHQSQRAPYSRLVSLLDGKPQPPDTPATTTPAADKTDSAAKSEPLFFSGTVRSLSDTFSALQSELIVERPHDGVLRQTVVYTW